MADPTGGLDRAFGIVGCAIAIAVVTAIPLSLSRHRPSAAGADGVIRMRSDGGAGRGAERARRIVAAAFAEKASLRAMIVASSRCMNAHGRGTGTAWGDAWAEASWMLKAQAERLHCESCSAVIAYAGRAAYVDSGLCELCCAGRQAGAPGAGWIGRSFGRQQSPPGVPRPATLRISWSGPRPAVAGRARSLPRAPRFRIVRAP